MLRSTRHLLLLSVLAAAACGGSVRDSGTIQSVEYSVSAQQNYERGMKKLQDEVPPVQFEQVRTMIENELGGTAMQ